MSKTTQSSTKHERKKEKRHKGSYPPRGWRGQLLAIALLCATTIVFIYVLSPGLRPELGRLTALADGLDALALRDWILSFGVFSPLAYFLVVVAQVIASPIPAGPVTVAGALVFGVWKGLALSMAGSTVGSVLVFVATRRWGEPLVIRLIGKEIFYKYIGRLDPNG